MAELTAKIAEDRRAATFVREASAPTSRMIACSARDVASHERLARHDFPALAQRADDQLARVEVLRLDAARTAFMEVRTAEPRAQASI